MQARESNAVRGNAVEETSVILLEFESGLLATLSVSDSVVAPWSWEMTTGENPVYPKVDESCYVIGGTLGSITIPTFDLWKNSDKRSWWVPLDKSRIVFDEADPLALQIQQFCKVIRGEEPPLVSGREGLNTLRVISAVKHAARSGELIKL